MQGFRLGWGGGGGIEVQTGEIVYTSLLALVTYEETLCTHTLSPRQLTLPFQVVSMATGLQYYIDRPLTLHSSHTSDGIPRGKQVPPQVDVRCMNFTNVRLRANLKFST